MEISKKCPFSGQENTMKLDCTQQQFNQGCMDYKNGKMIQDAFPFLSADEREFIKTGITPQKWNEIFGSD